MNEDEAIQKCYELKNLYVTEAPDSNPKPTGLIDDLIKAIVICDFVKIEEIEGKEQSVFQPEAIARAAARVALKWIEKAYKDSTLGLSYPEMLEIRYQKWLKENNLIDKSPGIESNYAIIDEFTKESVVTKTCRDDKEPFSSL
jgi:hypothetical protein